MKLDDLWKEIEDFNDEHFPDWRKEDLRLISNALAGEVGELCDATKHFYGGGTNPDLVGNESMDHILEETFDAIVYAILLVGAMGATSDDFIAAGRRKLSVLRTRMLDKIGKL